MRLGTLRLCLQHNMKVVMLNHAPVWFIASLVYSHKTFRLYWLDPEVGIPHIRSPTWLFYLWHRRLSICFKSGESSQHAQIFHGAFTTLSGFPNVSSPYVHKGGTRLSQSCSPLSWVAVYRVEASAWSASWQARNSRHKRIVWYSIWKRRGRFTRRRSRQ